MKFNISTNSIEIFLTVEYSLSVDNVEKYYACQISLQSFWLVGLNFYQLCEILAKILFKTQGPSLSHFLELCFVKTIRFPGFFHQIFWRGWWNRVLHLQESWFQYFICEKRSNFLPLIQMMELKLRNRTPTFLLSRSRLIILYNSPMDLFRFWYKMLIIYIYSNTNSASVPTLPWFKSPQFKFSETFRSLNIY